MMVSIIIPTLNEAENIRRLLPELLSLRPIPEVIVVDGGSSDGTRTLAEQHGVLTLQTMANRARQLNQGAGLARGDLLLFLHADCRLGQEAYQALLEAMRDPGVIAGAFRYRLESSRFDWRERLIEWGTNLRVRLFRLPYGDQGYFVRCHCFGQSGGFQPLPLLEDVEWFRRISRMGRITLLNAPMTTSARRIRERGWIRSILINGSVILLYTLGVSPERLAPIYYRSKKVGKP